jgi:hypothetical protein
MPAFPSPTSSRPCPWAVACESVTLSPLRGLGDLREELRWVTEGK